MGAKVPQPAPKDAKPPEVPPPPPPPVKREPAIDQRVCPRCKNASR